MIHIRGKVSERQRLASGKTFHLFINGCKFWLGIKSKAEKINSSLKKNVFVIHFYSLFVVRRVKEVSQTDPRKIAKRLFKPKCFIGFPNI